MTIGAKKGRGTLFFKKRAPGAEGGAWVRTGSLVLMVVLGYAAVAGEGSAMFVSPAPKKEEPTETNTPKIRPEDVRLQRQIEAIRPVPVKKRKVNSNIFSRMSGQTKNLKPVAIPASSVEIAQAPTAAIDESFGASETIFTIGSWAFILACVGAAAIGLLKIKKLSSSS